MVPLFCRDGTDLYSDSLGELHATEAIQHFTVKQGRPHHRTLRYSLVRIARKPRMQRPRAYIEVCIVVRVLGSPKHLAGPAQTLQLGHS